MSEREQLDLHVRIIYNRTNKDKLEKYNLNIQENTKEYEYFLPWKLTDKSNKLEK